MTDFDIMTERFTQLVRHVVEWKHNYYGATYTTRIRQAVETLKEAIAVAEANPEIGEKK